MKRKDFIKNTTLAFSSLALLGATKTNVQQREVEVVSPPLLKKGDTLALFAPAGAVFSPKHIQKATQALEKYGYKVHKAKSLYSQEGYFSDTAVRRAREFNALIEDTTIKALIAMRGGYGCAQLLDKIDLELIRQHPKVIMGYSDLTILLNYITEKTGLITYHGIMGYSTWNDFACQEFSAQLENTLNKRKLTNPVDDQKQLKTYQKGKAVGKLCGGNLSVLCSALGTSASPNYKGKILLLEETHEEPYRIDRMLFQLKSAGVFEQVNGIVLGKFTHCEAENPEESYALEEVFEQYFKELQIPIYSGAAFGHVINKFILPIGAIAEIDADAYSILINL